MVRVSNNDQFHKAICQNELVYFFGTGISSALTKQPFSWYKWISDGLQLIKDNALSDYLKKRLDADSSADNLIQIIGEVLAVLKDEGSYEKWMQESFEKKHIEDYGLARTLKKLLILNDFLVTTNYDRLIEEATGAGSLTYKEPDKVFDMLKYKRMKSILHIHGMYDSAHGVDNIIADRSQYESILDNKGAQFLQNLLGTRNVIFIGCGKTTEDANIAQFIRFSKEWLRINVTYYYLHNAATDIEGLPDNIVPICYGDDYSELPEYLENMICERLKAKIEKQRLIGRTIFSEATNNNFGLSEYHYSREYLKFCGRKKELGSLEVFLENDAHSLWWALTGQAGSGKSRLAFEFIHRIPKSYFGFFINPAAGADSVKEFIPFSDTLVIVDYVKGNEKNIADIVLGLFDVFNQPENENYKFRLIFVERENLTVSGTWYYALEQAFSYYDRVTFKKAEYKPYLSSREHEFICIDDLDDDAVVELIGDICDKKGLPKDLNRDHRLRDEYASKFEQLRFRPLFLQLYVQAWIENGKSDIDYRSYRDILKAVLDKEKEHLMMIVEGDKACATSLIRLLTRACIFPLNEESLPEVYIKDWEAVKKYVENDTLPGIERKEELFSIVKDASHGMNDSVGVKGFVIDPLYPDIIKEAFFLQYVDDIENFGHELWMNAPVEYSIFLYRCAVDFPDDKGLREYIQSQTIKYDNIPAMYARISLLHHEIITIDDNPVDLQKEVDEEYAYWQRVPTDGEMADELRQVRLEGIHDSLLMYTGWSNVNRGMDAIKELADTPDTPFLRERKCLYLLDMVKYLTNGGLVSVNTSEYTIGLLRNVLSEMNEDSDFYHYIKLSIDSYHIQNSIIAIEPNKKYLSGYSQEDWDTVKKMLSDLKGACNLGNERDAEIYAYTVYRCTALAREKLAGGNICYFCDELQDYAVDYASSNGKLAFNDQIHYYYLHAKFVDTESVCMASTLAFGQSGYASSKIDGYIDEIEKNEMIRDFSGLLVGALALKVGFDEEVTDAEVNSYIERAKGYIEDYPDNSFLAEKYFDLLSAALDFQFKRPASKNEIVYGYSLALRFPLEKGVLKGFFELLKNSFEYRNWRLYLNNKQIRTGLVQNGLEKYFTEMIPVSLGPAYPNPITVKENTFVQSMMPEVTSTYIRNHKKIGANDPCPCGSGIKFKKCCRGKGLFD